MENSFEIGEIVLGKVKGYPYWPGIITRKKGKSPKTVYTIKFFGDHSFSALKKKYIKKYQMDFVDKNLLESNINMKQSIEEAEDALYYHFIKKDLDFLTKSVQFLKTFTFCLDFVSNTKIGIMIDYMHKNLDPNKKENQNLIQQLQSLIQKIKSDCQ